MNRAVLIRSVLLIMFLDVLSASHLASNITTDICSQWDDNCESCVQSGSCMFAELRTRLACLRKGENEKVRSVIYRKSQCKSMGFYFRSALLPRATHSNNTANGTSNATGNKTPNVNELHVKSISHAPGGISFSTFKPTPNVTNAGKVPILPPISDSNEEENRTVSAEELSSDEVIEFFGWSLPQVYNCISLKVDKWQERLESAFCYALSLMKNGNRLTRMTKSAMAHYYSNPAQDQDEHCLYLHWRQTLCKN